MNFLDAFYKFYNKLKKDADFREENNIDDAEFKEWEKIIEYKPKKKKIMNITMKNMEFINLLMIKRKEKHKMNIK